jgi:hypothetical protein
MDVEILGLVGFVFAAVSLAAIAYEHRLDVLRGSYLEDRAVEGPCHSARQLWTPSVLDRLRWKAQTVIYLASTVAY